MFADQILVGVLPGRLEYSAAAQSASQTPVASGRGRSSSTAQDFGPPKTIFLASKEELPNTAPLQQLRGVGGRSRRSFNLGQSTPVTVEEYLFNIQLEFEPFSIFEISVDADRSVAHLVDEAYKKAELQKQFERKHIVLYICQNNGVSYELWEDTKIRNIPYDLTLVCALGVGALCVTLCFCRNIWS